ncbi:DEKNAAC100463 [Brettanomyces naardenensis]|uniref:DEKNAAC100463 n=1 Tax=Brettanomyces naardenensis TaxID=13370 RepID=A0A448YGL1_BRENA|nr:DEKNAAC100463 [Brettanomyces naardenensis]
MLYASKKPPNISQLLSVILQVKPTTQQKQLLNQKLVLLNNSIRSRYNDLNRGFFNGLSIPFNPPNSTPIVPYDLPYDALIRGLDESTIIGRSIDPGLLNHSRGTRWPLRYFNDSLLDEQSTNALHASLTPMINYTSEETLTRYKRLVESKVELLHSENPDGLYLDVSFKNRFKIFTRYDYSKFFLVMPLSDECLSTLRPISDSFSQMRKDETGDIGSVIGEPNGQPLMRQDDLHVTLGICAFPFGEDYFSSNCSFGMYELQYMNDVLLLPKEELMARYGEEAKTLEYVSDVELTFTPEEINQLAFKSNELILSIGGGQLRYPL